MPSYEPARTPASSGLFSSMRRPRNLPLLALGAGLVIGLIIGLIVGWLVWPVQWTNAWPADLSPEARAQYLAAVAESYSYYSDAEAAETARNRLYNLNDNLAEEIAAAQRFFADNPQNSSRIYISKLGELAQGLGITSPDILVDTPSAEAAAAAPEASPAEAADVGSSVRTWVNWTLSLLAALLLLGGGLYILARLSQRRMATAGADRLDDGPEGFDEEETFGPPPSTDLFRRPAPMPAAAPPEPAPPRDRAAAGFDTRRREEYGFDAESEDRPVAYSQGKPIDDLADEDDDLYEDVRLAEEDEDFDELPPAAPTMTAVAPRLDGLPVEPAASRPGGSDAAAGEILKTFTVHYQAGIPDYDQSYSILDAESGRYIGECGMGVNLKNGILQNNPDNVVALDVWLVDKKQEKSYSSQSRVLFSEYVIDNKLEQAFTRERPNDAPPLVPQPGMTFQLKGPNLTLDCEVVEAVYTRNGPSSGIFQSVKIDMTVRAKD